MFSARLKRGWAVSKTWRGRARVSKVGEGTLLDEQQGNEEIHHVSWTLRYLWPPDFPHPAVVPITGVYLRRTIDKVNPDSEIKLCIGVGAVEGSGHTLFKI